MQTNKFTTATKLNQEGSLIKKSNTNLWIVKEPFEWQVEYNDDRYGKIIVPEGFETDFGSIPQALWWMFNPTKYVAYILHDYIYEMYGQIPTTLFDTPATLDYTRKQADYVLLEALKAEKCPFIKRWLIYFGVRIWGWMAWKK